MKQSEAETRNEKFSRKRIAIIAIIIIAAIGLSYLYFSGSSTVGKIDSVDVRVKGYFSDISETITGTVRMKARDIQSGDPDVRINSSPGGSENYILIYNSKDEVFYSHSSGENSWMSISESGVGDSLQGFANSMKDWVNSEKDEMVVQYQNTKVEIDVIEINPNLKNSLFNPPPNADIDNYVVSSPGHADFVK